MGTEAETKGGVNCPICGGQLPDVGVVVDTKEGLVVVDGKRVKLQRMESKFLKAVADRYPRLVTREVIMDELYGLFSEKEEPSMHILTVYKCRVNKVLKNTSWELQNVWGVGYRLVKIEPLQMSLAV